MKLLVLKPGNSSYPLPPEKNFERPPRAPERADRAEASTNVSGRASSVRVLIVIWRKVLVRREKLVKLRKLTNISIHIFYVSVRAEAI